MTVWVGFGNCFACSWAGEVGWKADKGLGVIWTLGRWFPWPPLIPSGLELVITHGWDLALNWKLEPQFPLFYFRLFLSSSFFVFLCGSLRDFFFQKSDSVPTNLKSRIKGSRFPRKMEVCFKNPRLFPRVSKSVFFQEFQEG